MQQKDATLALLRDGLGSEFEQTWADAGLRPVEDVIADESQADADVGALQ